jgi:hypothetical protein
MRKIPITSIFFSADRAVTPIFWCSDTLCIERLGCADVVKGRLVAARLSAGPVGDPESAEWLLLAL